MSQPLTVEPAIQDLLARTYPGSKADRDLAAIVKAAGLGADMVELDVHTSSDNVPVIIHDANLSRTTNGAGEVSEYTLAELKKLDAGQGQAIPTLAEAIACCQEHMLGLYLEVKSSRAIPAVVDLVRQHDFYRQTIVTSFRPDWLADVRALDPDIVTNVLFGSVAIDPVALARAAGAQYVHPAWMSRVRAAGLGLTCWHEERPSEIAALRQLGADGICSNAPDLLL